MAMAAGAIRAGVVTRLPEEEGPVRKGWWSWGAAELRRAAEADNQGRTASETTSRGGRYLKHRPPLRPCRPLDQARAV